MLDSLWRHGRPLRRSVYAAAVLAVLTCIALVVFGGGLTAVAGAMAGVPLGYVALAALGTLVEWAADTARYVVAGRAVGVSLPVRTWLAIALVTLFAAYVANVGIPVAAYVMARRGAPPGEALAVAVGKNLLFFPSALLPAWLLMARAPGHEFGGALFGSVTVLVVLSVAQLASMVALAIWPERATRLARRLPFVGRSEVAGRFIAGIARFFRGRPSLLVLSLATALVNQAALVFVIAILLRGFGGDALAPGALARCTLFSAISQVSPTPGGAFLSEASGVLLLRPLLLSDAALVAHVAVSRFFCAGLPIVAGGLLLARELSVSTVRKGAPV